MTSGFSGASFANRSLVSTARANPASSNTFVPTVATRLPNRDVTETAASSASPAVVTSLRAYRVFPFVPAVTLTWHPSAFDNPSTRSHSCRAAARDRPLQSATIPPGVQNVDTLESRGRTAVAHRVRLARLAFAVGERAVHQIRRLAADHVHGIPKIGRSRLVGDVLQHAGDLAAFDLIEHLAA